MIWLYIILFILGLGASTASITLSSLTFAKKSKKNFTFINCCLLSGLLPILLFFIAWPFLGAFLVVWTAFAVILILIIITSGILFLVLFLMLQSKNKNQK